MENKVEHACGPRMVKSYLDKVTTPEFEKMGITPSMGMVLRVVRRHEGASMKDVSETLMIDKAMVTRMVLKLLDLKLLENTASGHVYSLVLTEEGMKAAVRSKEILDNAWQELLIDITPEEREVFDAVLMKISDRIRRSLQ
jgi:DNA-binding MarR family transcriptional regulator